MNSVRRHKLREEAYRSAHLCADIAGKLFRGESGDAAWLLTESRCLARTAEKLVKGRSRIASRKSK